MRSQEEWRALLDAQASASQFSDGYQLLYCPWSTIHSADVAFISLNPGRSSEGSVCRTEDVRGNSYEVEVETTLSPLTAQFLKMCDRLGIRPAQVLTGVAHPFRSGDWNGLSKSQKSEGLATGKLFWQDALQANAGRVKLFITVSDEARKLALAVTGAIEETRMPSGWAKTQLIRYRNDAGQYVVSLPHLSSFQLFSREACAEPLRAIFTGTHVQN